MPSSFQDFDDTKTYKTIDRLLIAITDARLADLRYLIVKVPSGKNENRFTAIFHAAGGEGMAATFQGFKVMA